MLSAVDLRWADRMKELLYALPPLSHEKLETSPQSLGFRKSIQKQQLHDIGPLSAATHLHIKVREARLHVHCLFTIGLNLGVVKSTRVGCWADGRLPFQAQIARAAAGSAARPRTMAC